MTSDERSTPPFDRGHVVWHDGLFGQSGRPWLVVSSKTHPFHGEEYVVCGITTTERAGAVTLLDDAWAIGGLPRTSYVSPSFLTTLKHADIDRGVGELSAPAVESVLDELMSYFHFDGGDGATT